jgi:hypothetical protein
MKHIITHDLGEQVARTTAERALTSYQERFPHANIEASWRNATTADVRLGVKGVQLDGTLTISATSITFDLAVPFLLRPFQQKAMSVIDREVNRWLEVARQNRGEQASV